MAEPFKEILAIIEQNKAKTETVAELERRLQNLQESSVKQYALMQQKDQELTRLQTEIQQNQERADLVASLEKQLQNVQEANKQRLAEIQQKDRELGKLEMKLDAVAAKRHSEQVEETEQDDYWISLMEIQSRIQYLTQHVSELGDTVSNFDGKLQVEDYECPDYDTMKKQHEDVAQTVKKKEETLQNLKRTYETNVEKLTRDNESKTESIHQLQQQVYDKSLQLSSAQTALSLSHERLALMKPEWMEKNQQFEGGYRN